MTPIRNPQQEKARNSLVLSIVFLLAALSPTVIEMDMEDEGLIAVLCGISGVIGSLFAAAQFTREAKEYDRTLRGKNNILHWTPSNEEWESYFTHLPRKMTTWGFRRKIQSLLQDPHREIFVSSEGILIGTHFTSFKSIGKKFEWMQLVREPVPMLDFCYKEKGRYQSYFYHVYLPVPRSKIDAAERIVERFQHGLPKITPAQQKEMLLDEASASAREHQSFSQQESQQSFTPPAARSFLPKEQEDHTQKYSSRAAKSEYAQTDAIQYSSPSRSTFRMIVFVLAFGALAGCGYFLYQNHLAMKESLFELKGHKASIDRLLFSSDGKSLGVITFSTRDKDRMPEISIAKLDTRTVDWRPMLLESRMAITAFTPDLEHLLTIHPYWKNSFVVHFFSPERDVFSFIHYPRSLLVETMSITKALISPSGKYAAAIGTDMFLWDAYAIRTIDSLVLRRGGMLHDIAFTSDDELLVARDSAEYLLIEAFPSRIVRQWFTKNPGDGVSNDARILFNAPGTFALLVDADSIRIFEVGNVATVSSIPIQETRYKNLGRSPDGRFLLGRIDARNIRLIDATQSKTLEVTDDEYATCIFSPNGKRCALLRSADATVEIIDLPSMRPMRVIKHVDGLFTINPSVSAVAFSPDGKFLATANETIRLWNVQE